MTVPAFFRVRWHWSGTKSGAGLGSRSVPPRLRRCSCGRGLLVLGPARTPERQRVGPARCRGNRQAPVPGTARAPLPPPLRGVRSLCVVFIQTQIRLNYGRELDARASEGSVGKCLRERSDHDHWISPYNGEQNWHTVRSGAANVPSMFSISCCANLACAPTDLTANRELDSQIGDKSP